MQILLKTKVEQAPKEVMAAFDRELFIQLKPPGVGLKLLRFDGSETGDRIEMQLNFGLFKQNWRGRITDHGEERGGYYFVDEAEGEELPFFLKKWRHKHGVLPADSGSWIVDEIDYEAPSGLNLLLYPSLWLQFAYRKPIYRKYFRLAGPERQ